MFVFLLVAVVALWRGIGWYFDPLTEANQQAAKVAATPRPVRRAPGVPGPPPLPAPTAEEIALLSSSDASNRLLGVDTLAMRATTPEAISAVEAALASNPQPAGFEQGLVCLKSRVESPDTIEFVLARFPTDEKAVRAFNPTRDVRCMLDVLADHAAEVPPDRVLTAMMPAVYSGNGQSRESALRAFRAIDVDEIPPILLVAASTDGAPYHNEALQAALALGAIRLSPGLVAKAARSWTTDAVGVELKTSPHPNAARIVADVWSDRPDDRRLQLVAQDRERQHHDVSAGLLEIVLDSTRDDVKRTGAAQNLKVLAEVGTLRDLRAMIPSLTEGPLKASVVATVNVLEERVRHRQPELMHQLPPRI
jgi:hypothetical protein